MLSIEKITQLNGHEAAIYALCEGFDNQHFLSGAGEGWVVQWDAPSSDVGKLIARAPRNIFSLCNIQNATYQLIVAGDMDGGLHWLYPDDNALNKHIAHHQKGTYALLQVGQWLLSAGGDGLLTRWDVLAARSIESVQLSSRSLRCIAYDTSLNLLAVGSSDGNIYLLDADTLELLHSISTAHQNSVFSLAFLPNQSKLISGGRDAMLRVWDVIDLEQVACISSQPAHLFTINDIVIPRDKPWFATASRDKTIKIWDAHTFQLLKVIDTIRHGGHLRSVNQLLWLPAQELLASAGDDRVVMLWKIENR